jgi:hypothetical protein
MDQAKWGAGRFVSGPLASGPRQTPSAKRQRNVNIQDAVVLVVLPAGEGGRFRLNRIDAEDFR